MLKQLQSFFKTTWTLFNRYLLWVPLAAGLILTGCFTWYEFNLRPTAVSHPQTFKIVQGESVKAIAQNLEQQHFIRSASAFEIYVTVHGLRPRLQSGIYAPAAHAGAKEIAVMIANGRVDAKRLTIPEGSTIAKIKELAAAKGISAADLNTALAAYRVGNASSVVAGIPAAVDLEGYLFPDTYTISGDTPASDLVASMVTNLQDSVISLAPAFSAKGLTLHQALTLASMVEKEVATDSDRAMVAQVFLNRLRLGMRLESDVTVHYGADLLGANFSTALDSPYNTYRVDGLPIGPICNPGLSALQAVANPTPNDYLYFLAGKDGKTYFARTFEEHQSNIAKYLR